MSTSDTKAISDAIREIVWRFGASGLDGQCCGGLTSAEFRGLRTALAEKDCAMQLLAERLNFTRGGATRVVDRLEKRGLVKRVKSAEDGRVCCVRITAAGRSLIDAVNRDTESQIAGILSQMDPNMRPVVQAALGAFVAALRPGL
jgi:DNA-binding MarR family transcriptional regulator